MKPKKLKSAKAILAKFNAPAKTFAEYQEKSARKTHEMLGKVLSDVDLQRKLSIEYEIVEIKKFPAHSAFPAWARFLAHVLLDPSKKYSDQTRERVYTMCSDLYHEFGLEPEGRFLTIALMNEENVPIMSEIVKDLNSGEQEDAAFSSNLFNKFESMEVC